jgi:hypothetical protein
MNSDVYFCRVAGYIVTKFYGEKLKRKPTLNFRARLENAPRNKKDFWTNPDPYIDTRVLIMGEARAAFDLEAFVRTYSHTNVKIAELRKVVKRRVLHEDCPIVKIKRNIQLRNKQKADDSTVDVQHEKNDENGEENSLRRIDTTTSQRCKLNVNVEE